MIPQKTEQDYAIEELAECVKELVRLLSDPSGVPPTVYKEVYVERLNKVYKKATKAKNRVD